jgi:GntR family transcriptional regulator
MGLSRAQALEIAHAAIDAVYAAYPLRLKFLECNEHDAQALAAQLARLTDCQFEPGVLAEERLPALGERYDLVVTTFHHLAEVNRALAARRDRVIGVNALPTSETALSIARLEARRLGLVCGRETTVQSIKYLVASYHPDDQLDIALADDIERVRALARDSEALIVTYGCAAAVRALTGRQPDVVVEFQIEAQSIEFLRGRIQRLRGERAAAHEAPHGSAGHVD